VVEYLTVFDHVGFFFHLSEDFAARIFIEGEGDRFMAAIQQRVRETASPTLSPAVAPVLMMAFWMLLGAAFGIRLMESVWRLFGVEVGEVSIVVPVGGAVGTLGGALLGLISNPRLLVLLMAVFAGSAAGAVAGKLPWGDIGEIGGQVAGGLVGGIAWAAWLYFGRGTSPVFALKGRETNP
jgi:hypothetical protein